MSHALVRPDFTTPAALLQYDDFVRRLARGLVAQSADADDLVQQTFAAALAARPGMVASTRAWLGTLARNLASNARRTAARRARREALAAAGERGPSPDEILAREEARRDVVAQVLALEPTQREVVLLRFFEGLPPRAIARRLGDPVETVKTRLKRALAQLRARVDRERAWPALLWFARQPLRGGVVVASCKAVLLMAKQTPVVFAAAGVLLTVLVGLVAVAGALFLLPGGGPAGLAAPASGPAVGSAPGESTASEMAPATRPASMRVPVAAAVGPGLHVVEAAGGASVAGATIWEATGALVPGRVLQGIKRAVTDATGRARVSVERLPAKLIVRAAGFLPRTVSCPPDGEQLVELERGHSLAVDVRGPDGTGVADCPLLLCSIPCLRARSACSLPGLAFSC